jgi:hypothetical protein
MFSRLSIEEQAVEIAEHQDTISFLALMQHCELDLLPIKWQPALESLGAGGTAVVDQSLIHIQLSYAFKRILSFKASTGDIRQWATEVLVLCHPSIRGHPNIVQLEACSLEVLENGKIAPVLIFEKAHLSDLEHFIALEAAKVVPFESWLDLCIEIGSALQVMHSYSPYPALRKILTWLTSYRYRPQ